MHFYENLISTSSSNIWGYCFQYMQLVRLLVKISIKFLYFSLETFKIKAKKKQYNLFMPISRMGQFSQSKEQIKKGIKFRVKRRKIVYLINADHIVIIIKNNLQNLVFHIISEKTNITISNLFTQKPLYVTPSKISSRSWITPGFCASFPLFIPKPKLKYFLRTSSLPLYKM